MAQPQADADFAGVVGPGEGGPKVVLIDDQGADRLPVASRKEQWLRPLRQVEERHPAASISRVLIALEERSGPHVGARTRTRLAETLGAAAIALTDADVTAIEQAIPAGSAAGDRYATPLMAHLDSEH